MFLEYNTVPMFGFWCVYLGKLLSDMTTRSRTGGSTGSGGSRHRCGRRFTRRRSRRSGGRSRSSRSGRANGSGSGSFTKAKQTYSYYNSCVFRCVKDHNLQRFSPLLKKQEMRGFAGREKQPRSGALGAANRQPAS